MTNKQSNFCEEYVKDFNATKAATRAGYSPKTAYSIGSENLKKPEILERIEFKKRYVTEQTNLSLVTLIEDVFLIKEMCIYENFDPKNALKACELLFKFLTDHHKQQRESLSKIPMEDLEKLVKSFLTN